METQEKYDIRSTKEDSIEDQILKGIPIYIRLHFGWETH